MTLTPDVSVVMSVFNEAAFLPRTLESIFAQNGVSFELIVVDDGSTDESGPILESAARRDPRVRLIRQQNAGLTRALIAGCDAASAPLIARHDAGDLSEPDRLQKQKRVLKVNPEVVFVSCWTEFLGPEDEHLFEIRGSGRSNTPTELINVNAPHGVIDGPTHHGSVMFRRDTYRAAGGYRPQFYFGQDWDLWYRLAERGKFQMISEVLYRARIAPASVSSSARSEQQMLAALSHEALLARRRGASEEDVLRRAAAVRPRKKRSRRAGAQGLYFIGEALRRNGDRRAAAYFRRAIARDPILLRAWVRLAQMQIEKRRG